MSQFIKCINLVRKSRRSERSSRDVQIWFFFHLNNYCGSMRGEFKNALKLKDAEKY